MLDLTAVTGETSPRRCKAANGKIEVCADKYGNNGWLGLAQIWISGDHITKATAKMNDYYFTTAPYNVKYDTPAWRALVMCQEIGHDFGLGHRDVDFNNTNVGSCMDYTGSPESNKHPNAHDYEELESIYKHLDAPADDGGSSKACKGRKCKGSKTPPPAFDMELPNSGQWGRAIAVSRDGGQSVFVQDFGNGYKVYTHVTWTLEVAATLARR
ncbi:MAG: hypothetical protein IH939_20710 [Acidobacteria bacterium]|nr:hypothetical protein [Acidobacteriota bacterium]